MRKVNFPNFYANNLSYNNQIRPFVDIIFETEKREPLDYIPPRRYLSRAARKSVFERRDDVVQRPNHDADIKGRFDLQGAGDYDLVVLSALGWGHSSTYVLAGEMGSGKTATMNFLREVLSRRPLVKCSEKCHICMPEVVFVSLDAGTRYTAPNADPVSEFKKDLIDALHSRVRQLLIDEGLTQKFIDFTATASEQRYRRFSSLHTEITMMQLQRGLAFATFNEQQKTDILLDYVGRAGTPEARLDYLAAIASYVKREVRYHSACFTILVDNIDRHIAPSQQLAILRLLFGLQDTNIRVLVAMRETTFEGLGSIAAFSFQFIPHTGPKPLGIALRRVTYYLDVFDEWLKGAALTQFQVRCLRERLGAIKTLLQEDSIHRNRLAALAGASVRAGLTVLARLALNGTIPAEAAAPAHKHDWFRAALLGMNTDQHFKADDRYVTNIFADPDSASFSWLPIRFLQLVELLFTSRGARNAKNLCAIIEQVIGDDFANDRIHVSVNHLLTPTRPLVWTDGVYTYPSYDELLGRNDVFHLTKAGHLFLKQLLSDSVYLQEALVALAWKSPLAPADIDCRTAVDRSRGMRAIGDLLLTEDVPQHARLIEVMRRSRYMPRNNPIPLSLTILVALTRGAVESMKNSIGGSVSTWDIANEARGWRELFVKAERLLSPLLARLPKSFSSVAADIDALITLVNTLSQRRQA